MKQSLKVSIERFPIHGSFTIARGSKTEAVVVAVEITHQTKDSWVIGRGECVPYTRYGESVEGVAQLIRSIEPKINQGLDRMALQSELPPGAARNAVDCAFWDLESKISGRSVAELAGLPQAQPVTTAYTISLGTPESMAKAAALASHRDLLKIKLGGEGGDFDRIRAVRQAAPRSILIADANEGWTSENLTEHLRLCKENGFALIEQPLPEKQDESLRSIEHLVPICADESVHDRQSLTRLVGLYDSINVKLDKTGGLTEALAMSTSALKMGFEIMIGCMVGTSLAMAPAMAISPLAKYVDLDGPLLLAHDREPSLLYQGSLVHPPRAELWG